MSALDASCTLVGHGLVVAGEVVNYAVATYMDDITLACSVKDIVALAAKG